MTDEAIKVREDVVIPASEVWFTASRSGGPGGQHINTTSSRVTLHWDVENTKALNPEEKALVMRVLASRISQQGVLAVSAETERSQHRNREIARSRLVDLVANALVKPKKRLPTKSPESARQRRLDEKIKRKRIKQLRTTPEVDD